MLYDFPGWLTERELDFIWRVGSYVDTVLEIGSLFGRSTSAWLESYRDTRYLQHRIRVYSCDPMATLASDIGPLDSMNGDTSGIDFRTATYPTFLRNMQGFIKRGDLFHLRCSSEDLRKNWHFGKVDAVFVDGDHSERMVEHDLRLALSLLNPHGFILVHDYGHREIPGVKASVDRILTEDPKLRMIRVLGTSLVALTRRPKVVNVLDNLVADQVSSLVKIEYTAELKTSKAFAAWDRVFTFGSDTSRSLCDVVSKHFDKVMSSGMVNCYAAMPEAISLARDDLIEILQNYLIITSRSSAEGEEDEVSTDHGSDGTGSSAAVVGGPETHRLDAADQREAAGGAADQPGVAASTDASPPNSGGVGIPAPVTNEDLSREIHFGEEI